MSAARSHGVLERNGAALDLGDGRLARVLAEEPRLGQRAGALGPDDAAALHGDAQVVADAAADGAGDIGDLVRHSALVTKDRPGSTTGELPHFISAEERRLVAAFLRTWATTP